MIKKILIYFTFFLFFILSFNKVYAKSLNGSGEVILSTQTVSAFYTYLNYVKGRPFIFVLHPSGKYYAYWYCPREYSSCDTSQNHILLLECKKWANEKGEPGKCYIFAKRSRIYWKNSSNDKFIKIPKKMSEDELKSFLFKHNFLTSEINVQTFDTDNPDLIEKIKGLQKLYDQGALTKEDFEKAKKKLLSK